VLVFLRVERSLSERGVMQVDRRFIEVVDLSNPAAPATAKLELPGSNGLTGLVLDGSSVLTSHFEPLDGDPSRVRFYVDRIDVSKPAEPRWVGKINVPGSLFAWDSSSRRAITIDYRRVVLKNITSTVCFNDARGEVLWTPNDLSNGYSEGALGICESVRRTLRQVRLDERTATLEGSFELEPQHTPVRSAVGDDRVFIALGDYAVFRGCYGCPQQRAIQSPLLALSGLNAGRLRVSSLELGVQPFWGFGALAAFGKRALVATGYATDLVVIDAENPDAPAAARSIQSRERVQNIVKSGDRAILALGYGGVDVVDMSR
jgi:hypothetical protein